MTFPRTPGELTVDWATSALDAEPGDILSVSTEFVGDAIGNTSDVYFVRLGLRDGVDLPTSMVAKMVPAFEGAIEVDQILKLFQREIEVYRHVAAHSPVRTPELIWAEYDQATSLGIMILEDISVFEALDQTQPVPTSLKDLERIIDAAGRLHAHWWGTDALDSSHGVLAPGDPVRLAFCEIVAGGWRDLLAGDGRSLIPEEGVAVAERFADHFVELANDRWPTDHLTLTHMDFRLDNMFFDREADEPVLFDWQAASLGRGPFDLAYLLSTGYEPGFRRQHEDRLLGRYHQMLVENGVAGYSLDDVKRDYRLGMLFSLWVVPFTVILDLSSERGQALMAKVVGGIFAGLMDHGGDAVLDDMLSD